MGIEIKMGLQKEMRYTDANRKYGNRMCGMGDNKNSIQSQNTNGTGNANGIGHGIKLIGNKIGIRICDWGFGARAGFFFCWESGSFLSLRRGKVL